MSYTVCPYLVSIDELKKAVGSKDRKLAQAVLNHIKERNETLDEDEWNTTATVKALVNGNLENDKIEGFQYGYALEAFCAYLGKREDVEALESVRSSSEFSDYWSWLFADQPLIPFNGYDGGDFPAIGYLYRADIPAEIQRTKELQFDKIVKQEQQQPNKAQLEMEWAVFSADYEPVPVSPADFPWLDESYYDSAQQELESLGFHKVRDVEYLHWSRVVPEVRNFSRSLINAERNISAAITQIRVAKPKTDEQKSIDVRCMEFTSEFSDGTFLVTTNMLGITVLESIEGITIQNFRPDISLKDLLYYQKTRIQLDCTWRKKELRTHATDDELIASGERQFLHWRADRQKKLQEAKTGMVTTLELDEETIECLEEIRTGLLALYEKALEANTDIVTFYY